jgi:hypothetical protein
VGPLLIDDGEVTFRFPSCAESRQRETRGISAACHGKPYAQVNHQPGYQVAAMGTEAVRFLVLWIVLAI